MIRRCWVEWQMRRYDLRSRFSPLCVWIDRYFRWETEEKKCASLWLKRQTADIKAHINYFNCCLFHGVRVKCRFWPLDSFETLCELFFFFYPKKDFTLKILLWKFKLIQTFKLIQAFGCVLIQFGVCHMYLENTVFSHAFDTWVFLSLDVVSWSLSYVWRQVVSSNTTYNIRNLYTYLKYYCNNVLLV